MSEGEIAPAPRKSKVKRIFLILASAFVLGVAILYCWSRYKFPYGGSHACSKVMGGELLAYASDHEHWLPFGEKTPEASLGLLYTNDLHVASWMLGGKIISHTVVETALRQNGNVSPSTCGWNYIEGLRDDDDPQIIVAWDKPIGLWHNGMREPSVMHEVILLDSSVEFIGTNEWKDFIADQKQRLEKVIASRSSNAPPIRWSDEENLGPNRFSPK